MRKLFATLPCLPLILGLCSTVAAKDHAAFIASCIENSNKYFIARDTFDAEGYARTFTEDGELIGHDTVIKGHKALAARIDGERGQTFDMHVMGTVEIVPVDDTTATGIVYTTVYQVEGEAAKKLPVTDFNIYSVIYTDTYKMTDEGCKFTTREATLNFMQKVTSK